MLLFVAMRVGRIKCSLYSRNWWKITTQNNFGDVQDTQDIFTCEH